MPQTQPQQGILQHFKDDDRNADSLQHHFLLTEPSVVLRRPCPFRCPSTERKGEWMYTLLIGERVSWNPWCCNAPIEHPCPEASLSHRRSREQGSSNALLRTGPVPSQPLCQGRIALPVHDAFDRHPNGLGWSDEDSQLLRASQSRIDQVTREQYIMLHEHGKNHDRVLTALAFVYRHRPGKGQLREIGIVVAHLPLAELHHDLLLFQINRCNRAQVAIEDFSLVVIDLLDHAVTDP